MSRGVVAVVPAGSCSARLTEFLKFMWGFCALAPRGQTAGVGPGKWGRGSEFKPDRARHWSFLFRQGMADQFFQARIQCYHALRYKSLRISTPPLLQNKHHAAPIRRHRHRKR